MKRIGITIGVGILSMGVAACTKASSSDKKLDQIASDVAALKKQLVGDTPANAKGKAPGAKGMAGRLQRRALNNNTPLGRIERHLARMERMIARGSMRGGARGRRPPRPDAKTVYSVPLNNSASVGPKHALVTMVEGFDFA